jgi:hypothetical protein
MEAHSQETLAHVHDGLDRGGGGGLIDDGPGARLNHTSMASLGQISYQTSCRCPATLAAGLKGSARAAVADIARNPTRKREKRGVILEVVWRGTGLSEFNELATTAVE